MGVVRGSWLVRHRKIAHWSLPVFFTNKDQMTKIFREALTSFNRGIMQQEVYGPGSVDSIKI
jgi:hypothetical protein